jgi:hypothetical protein
MDLSTTAKLWKRKNPLSLVVENLQMKSITAMELQELPISFLGSKIARCNLVKLQLLNGSCRELANPKLGRDFIAGKLEDGKSLGVFRLSILRSVEFALVSEQGAQVLEYTRRAIGELLTSQRFPTQAKLGYLDQDSPLQKIGLIGVARGFLFTEYYQNPAIPIASLGSIELDCA